ncbi:MAG: hypothetical protein ABW278_11210 [Steroidobacteraceae bacterium]
MFHALPLAAELARLRPGYSIETAVAGAQHLHCVRRVQQVYPEFRPLIHELAVPRLLQGLQAAGVMDQQARAARLLGALPLFRGMDAIIAPERTSLLLRPLLRRNTRLIFTPHGAGDRAIMVDWRDRWFDFVLVAGEKSERRMLAARTIRPGHYAVNGYVKLDLMQRLRGSQTPLFDNGRPVVLYAPHFRPALSSWPRWGRAVIEAFRAQQRYNLVVAPHIRLFHGASLAAKDELLALAEPGRIIIDLESDRLVDMTYTAQADVYLGDVSSQVYEFLAQPRPCVFLNAHGVAWQSDPNYRFWKLGEVVEDAALLLPAIDRSFARHAAYAGEQRAALAESIGADPAGAAQRGAAAIAAFLEGGAPAS